jgi:low affinity Fe/Cu permease
LHAFTGLSAQSLNVLSAMAIGNHKRSWFTRFAREASHWAGQPVAFVSAGAVVAVWALSGFVFGFSDTWQLVINTGTTIVTFLMVFVIQSSQNRDTEAIQVKLDELIRAIAGAQNRLLDLEELDAEEIDRIRKSYERLAAEAREGTRKSGAGT